MKRPQTTRALLLIASVATLFVLLPAAQPAAAAGATFTDRQRDVTVYSWQADRMYHNQEWDWADIAHIDVTTTTDKVQVSARIVDLQPGYWSAAQIAFEVNGDSSEDFSLTWLPDGQWGLNKKNGYNDVGTPIGCGGVSVGASYSTKRLTAVVPRSCLANTASVAISFSVYDTWSSTGGTCCQSWVLDSYPDALGQYSGRVQYEGTAAPAPAPAYDANGPTGTIYRLYRAYFLREPDKAGYDYWYGVYRNGYPLDKISNDFARSAEFQQRYGSVDNRRFLELVYQNVLGRAPDQGGYDYWLGHMDRGMLRGFVMIYFSDSEEFRAKTAAGRPPGY
jgi:hypothetical protein